MSALRKEKRGLCRTAFQYVELQRGYHFCPLLQAFRRKKPVRKCVGCDVRVTNRNLGGFDGQSALSGCLWCERCADFAPQSVLDLSGGGAP